MDALEDVTENGGAAAASAGPHGAPMPPAAPAYGDHPGNELALLRDRLARHDEQIETLRATTQKKRPWYLDIGPLISTVALLLSFSTTYYACQQQETQRIHDARVELRGLLQRLSELPRMNAALGEQYRDPMVIGQISAFIQQENKLLALHASELIDQLEAVDAQDISTSDYILVATAMFNSSLLSEGVALLDRAESKIRDAQDGATIYRTRGAVRFQLGDIEGGRADFLRALAIFQRFPTPSPFVEATTHAYTEWSWASAEFGVQQCQEAETHLRRAFTRLEPYINPTVSNPLVNQLRELEAQMASCGSSDQATIQMGLELAPLVAPLVNQGRPEADDGGK